MKRSLRADWVDPINYSRNQGAALPSRISRESFERLRAFAAREAHADHETQVAPVIKKAELVDTHTATKEQRRYASLADLPSTLVATGTGFYKDAHSVWELRASEDDSGYVLTRLFEETAPDLKTPEPGRKTANVSNLKPGQRVAAIINGQVVPSVVINVENSQVHVQPQQQPQSQAVVIPLQLAAPLGEPEDLSKGSMEPELGEVAGGDQLPEDAEDEPDDEAEEAEVEVDAAAESTEQLPGQSSQDQMSIMSSLAKKAMALRALQFSDAWGKHVQVQKPFSPMLMGGKVRLNPDDREVYEVEGSSIADPHTDKMYGIPHPALDHPSARSDEGYNDRIRLAPISGGPPLFVTPRELDRYFVESASPAGSSANKPLSPTLDMPGENVEESRVDTPDLTSLSRTRVTPGRAASWRPRTANYRRNM